MGTHHSLTGAIWQPTAVDEHSLARVRSESDLSDVAAQCLATRVGDNPCSDWLAPSIDHLHDPYDMMGMELAVVKLRKAIKDRKRIRIITDYDVDGTTSSLILQASLRLLDRDVQLDYHIPSRFGQGYGFSQTAADQAADDGVELIVTADIGVRDHLAVERARERGVDVLICDHHLPDGASVPDRATVLCPPQAGCTYPNRDLAACGVSLKLAQALLRDHPRFDDILASMLKLAAIGTVVDLVKLHSLENRAIVALGLAHLNQGPHHAGLQALLTACKLELGNISEGDLGFRIGPRINAAGRVADAEMVVRLLTCRDRDEAWKIAQTLEDLNRRRREIQKRLVAEALAQVGDNPSPFILVSGREDQGWHRGVVGIVASRLKDEYHRPVAVASIQGDKAVGSVRSIRGVHAVDALSSVGELLLKFGGHPAAAGFTVPTRYLDGLSDRLSEFVSSQTTAEDLVAVRRIDAEAQANSLDKRLHSELESLGPYGMGNPRPRLMLPGVTPMRVELKGAEQRMVKLLLKGPGSRPLDAIWWDQAKHAPTLRNGPIDLLCTLEENRYRGNSRLQLRIVDARTTV